MARQAGAVIQNKFVRGLITEATGLNFPEDAVTEADNSVFERTALVTRRLGIDSEDGSVNLSVVPQPVIHSFVWDIIDTVADIDLLVVQLGSTLRFYETGGTTLSGSIKSFTVNLLSFKRPTVSDADVRSIRASFAVGNGLLFVSHGLCDSFFISYNQSADTISTTALFLRVRDFEGTQEDVDVNNRPSSLTTKHLYDLDNQGWEDQVIDNTDTLVDPITEWVGIRSDYPSNADVWFRYKNATDQFDVSGQVDKFGIGNTPASKGHKIINPFDVTRAGVQTSSGVARPGSTAFFSGRVFWAGVRATGYSSKVYFSRLIENDSDYIKCFQINDPTSEILADLLPTDGGVINIQDVTNIIHLQVILDKLVVFASNGVWTIGGTELEGFSSDSFEVSKISSIGALSAYSIVIVDGLPIWWTEEGIYALAKPEISSDNFSVQSATNDTIKTFYQAIPEDSKFYAQGAYDRVERVVTWVYRRTEAADLAENFQYDRALNLNIDTRAFYPYTFGESSAKISTIINVEGRTNKTVVQGVIIGNFDTVIDASGNNIVVDLTEQVLTNSVNKFFLSGNSGVFLNKVTWGGIFDTTYLDFTNVEGTGVDYPSFFTSGYTLRGEGQRDFQSNYITVTSKTDANSGFLVSGRRDYAINSNSNLLTTKQQGYKHDVNKDYSSRKLKLRGNGKVMQYRVDSQTGKSFRIAGWSLFDTVNVAV